MVKSRKKADIIVSAANEADLKELLLDIRQCDEAELLASTGLEPEEILRLSYEMNGEKWAVRVKGDLLCIYGIEKSPQSGVGIPWLVGTNSIKKHKKDFLCVSRVLLGMAVDNYRALVNYVDARNEESILWLKWLGFDLKEAEPWGVEEMPFHRFEMITKYV